MMALSKKILEQEPSEIELLLPWHATGTLNARDARRVEEALARDPELAKQYAVIREEYAATVHLNESLGGPPPRAMLKLFAAIDAEPERKPSAWLTARARMSDFFASLSPRTLAWSASLAVLALLLQAGAIAVMVAKNQPVTYETASLSANEPESMTRALVPEAASPPRALDKVAPPRALVRFAPDARMADVTALLDSYHAQILDGASGGMFRVQFGGRSMTSDEAAALLARLQKEKIVSLAVAAP
jgi:anti-sigma factor RsiW